MVSLVSILPRYLPAPAGVLLLERLVLAERTEAGDIHRLEELMIVGPHEAVAAVVDGDLHAVELGRDLERLDRLRFVGGLDEHADLIDGARIEQRDRRPWRGTPSRTRGPAAYGSFATPSAIDKHAIRQIGLLDRRRAAGAAGIVGIPIDLQSGVGRGLDQQGDILAPVAGDDAVGAGGLDLGDIRREVGDLEQGMHLVADDLDVRPFGVEHLARLGAHRLAERIVLVDQIDLFDVRRASSCSW